ncbi:hypothetical protein [Phytomonospora endophytica]|uniref:Uncharacterized protein n=1 Tax=Phytomonospora endophytica TaxID=714109 RepID=A0A841FXC0_9ACTN|nr:hypothetical protein [Phytomonospora endophytica]MBB6037997.1 hypothetical protein [Phytomonospora endophytica]
MDYDTFSEKLQSNWDELMDVALAKITAEKEALWRMTGDVPIAGAIYHIVNNDELGQTDASRTSETLIDLEDFAARCGDYADIAAMVDDFEAAREILNGDDGVDGDIRAITEGLADWESSTSETFKVSYVETIGQRKTNQYEALGSAKTALEYVIAFIDEYRAALLDLPVQAKKALEEYHVDHYSALGTAAIAVSIIGMLVNPVAGLAAAEVEKKIKELQKREGIGVSGVFEELRKGVEELHASLDESMEDLSTKIAERRDGEWWSDFVSSRPAPDGALADQSSTSSGSNHTGGGA